MSDDSGGAVEIYAGGACGGPHGHGGWGALLRCHLRWKVSGWQPRGEEPTEDAEQWRQLDTVMEPHDVSACTRCRWAGARCANRPRPEVRPRGYRTKAGDAYHNDPHRTWMHRGQRRAERQGKNVHEIVGMARSDVPPGELEACESCCTPEWLKRHGY